MKKIQFADQGVDLSFVSEKKDIASFGCRVDDAPVDDGVSAAGEKFLFDERGRPEIGVRNEKKQKAGFGTKEGVGPGIRSDGADHTRKIIFGFEADWKYRHAGPFLYMS